MDTNIVNIRNISVWWCFYVLNYTKATFKAHSVHEKVKQQWGWTEKKKRVAYSKKRVFIYREVFDLHSSARRFTPFLSKYTNSLNNKKS